jgi:uncharacterized peroxidase-related enzyme
MTNTQSTDTIDRLVGLNPALSTFAVRHQRDKVVAATQKSEDGLFDPALPGLSLNERLLVALLACTLTPSVTCAAEYRDRLLALGTDPTLIDTVSAGAYNQLTDARLQAILTFTHTLITDPVKADQAALKALPQAGLSTPEVVTLAQLIAFVSYQVRVVAGLTAMKLLEQQV